MTASGATGPDPVPVDSSDHVLTTLWRRRESDPDRPLLARPVAGGWERITRAELVERVVSVAAGLVAAGVGPGDRVAIMSPTRPEWTIADLATLAVGGVTVPVYDSSSTAQCRAIVSDARPRLALAADDDLAARLGEAGVDDVVTFDGGGLDDLAATADGRHRAEVERRLGGRQGSDEASVVYTSGTTGEPKGCVLTHHHLVWTARQAVHRLGGALEPGDSTLLFLPLAHVFTRVVQLVGLEADLLVGHARSLDDLPDDLRSFRPTFLLGVPRIFEKLVDAGRREATGWRSIAFQLALDAGIGWSRAHRPGPLLRARRAVADRLVLSSFRQGVGGRVRFCVSGGAPLDPDLGHLFRAAGMPVLEGYGLTETTGPAAVNTPSELRIGSVGRPLPGVEIELADDGELRVRGPSVIGGYHDDPERTAEVLDEEGWFRTGDLGRIDDDGYIEVTDRKKALIVTANGETVAPEPLERRIRSHPLVSHAMVVGDGQPFVAAVVTLDPDELRRFAAERRLPDEPADRLRDRDEVRAEVQGAVDRANERVSRAESVRELRILGRDLSEEAGELSHTMDLRRPVVAEHFAEEIESIYDRSG